MYAREAQMREIGHFIGGKRVAGTSGRSGDVFDPNTGAVQATVGFANRSEVELAIANAEAAQPSWATVNPQRRARVLFKFLELVQREFDSLAKRRIDHMRVTQQRGGVSPDLIDAIKGPDLLRRRVGRRRTSYTLHQNALHQNRNRRDPHICASSLFPDRYFQNVAGMGRQETGVVFRTVSR